MPLLYKVNNFNDNIGDFNIALFTSDQIEALSLSFVDYPFSDASTNDNAVLVNEASELSASSVVERPDFTNYDPSLGLFDANFSFEDNAKYYEAQGSQANLASIDFLSIDENKLIGAVAQFTAETPGIDAADLAGAIAAIQEAYNPTEDGDVHYTDFVVFQLLTSFYGLDDLDHIYASLGVIGFVSIFNKVTSTNYATVDTSDVDGCLQNPNLYITTLVLLETAAPFNIFDDEEYPVRTFTEAPSNTALAEYKVDFVDETVYFVVKADESTTPAADWFLVEIKKPTFEALARAVDQYKSDNNIVQDVPVAILSDNLERVAGFNDEYPAVYNLLEYIADVYNETVTPGLSLLLANFVIDEIKHQYEDITVDKLQTVEELSQFVAQLKVTVED